MDKVEMSVLMSVYAKESPKYFHESLLSLVKQSHPAEQVVVVCDGPLTKELECVLEAFSDMLPLTVARLPTNGGLAVALNHGLAFCTSEWIARFDSDDVCERDRLLAQRVYIRNNPTVDVVGSSILEFSGDPYCPHACRSVYTNHQDIIIQAKRRNPVNHMTVVFRKSAVVAAGGYPRDHLYEDYCLWVNLIMRGCRFGNIAAPLVRARAGAAMIDRRGGLEYVKSEIGAQLKFWRMGFISAPQFLFNVGVRLAVRLAPSRLRWLIYQFALRQKQG